MEIVVLARFRRAFLRAGGAFGEHAHAFARGLMRERRSFLLT